MGCSTWSGVWPASGPRQPRPPWSRPEPCSKGSATSPRPRWRQPVTGSKTSSAWSRRSPPPAAIDESQAVVVARRQEAAALEERARLLEGVSILRASPSWPSRSPTDERIRLADERLAQAREELDAAQTEAAGLPSADTLSAAAQGHERLQAAAAKVHSIDLEALERQVADARAAVDGAVAARDRAVAEHEQARSRHAAHALVAGLCAGDPCPVCEQPLPEDPERAPAGLDERAGPSKPPRSR